MSLPHRLGAVIVGALFLLWSPAGVLLDPAHAASDTNSSTSVTWSVEPADETKATGDAWLELTLDAGQTVTEHMLVANRGSSDVTFRLSAADGYFTDTGRFTMLPSDQRSVDAGTWITIPETVDVAAGQSALIAFDITVPENATPGDHPAGVAAGIRTGGDTVGVESRVGFRVMTRVSGELTPALSVVSQSVTYTPSWNPFVAGALTVTADVVNSGNTRLGASPVVQSSGPFDVLGTRVALAALPEFAPGETRSISATVHDVWPTFATEVQTRFDPVAIDTSGISGAPAVRQTTTMSIPWSQLGMLAVLVLAAVLLMWRGRAKKASVQRMIENAREEGRRQGPPTLRGSLLIVGVLAAGILASPPAPSWADTPAGEVSVHVDVTPLPTPLPSLPMPSPTPTNAGSSRSPSGSLAESGNAAEPWLAIAASGVLLLGVGGVWTAARARVHDPR